MALENREDGILLSIGFFLVYLNHFTCLCFPLMLEAVVSILCTSLSPPSTMPPGNQTSEQFAECVKRNTIIDSYII